VSRVYWDTMLFIYWLEDHPEFAKRVNAIHSRMEQRHDQLITGAFTFERYLPAPIAKARRTWRTSRDAGWGAW